ETSLSVGFVEYCAFLKRHAYVDIDRARNTIAVLPRGKNVAEGGGDPSLSPTLAAHFTKQLSAAGGGANVIVARDELNKGAPGVAPVAKPASSSGFGASQPVSIALDAIMIDRYPRGAQIGQGSLGPVFRARDSVLERDVVVKEARHVFELATYLPREEISRRVRDAVMSQAKLDHPHIVRVLDVNFVGDFPTITFERATGGSLRERMQRGTLPVPVVMRLVLQASYGLHHAHKHGVVHGGIKPENVLFDAAGNVRLSDFGLARTAERMPDNTTSAPPVYVGRGNPSYMAPEQLHKGEITKATDVYGLGILLYELLTGTLPGRRSPMPSSTPRVKEALGDKGSKAVDDLFDKMTRDPVSERFPDFDEVLAAVYGALPDAGSLTRGTLLLYEVDPVPPPAAPPGPAVSAEGEIVDDLAVVSAVDVSAQ
ncbi:MAG TPA: serine/threonine-protein kinase, partial [Myxococcota bacterium]